MDGRVSRGEQPRHGLISVNAGTPAPKLPEPAAGTTGVIVSSSRVLAEAAATSAPRRLRVRSVGEREGRGWRLSGVGRLSCWPNSTPRVAHSGRASGRLSQDRFTKSSGAKRLGLGLGTLVLEPRDRAGRPNPCHRGVRVRASESEGDPMRILMVPQSWWPQIGGVERVGTQLVQLLLARGHQVLVAVPPPDDPPATRFTMADPGWVVRLPRPPGVDVRGGLFDVADRAADTFRWVARCIADFEPDVIHIVFPVGWSCLAAVAASAAAGVATVVSLHGSDVTVGVQYPLCKAIAARSTRTAALVTAVSSALGEEAVRRGICGCNPLTIHNGVANPSAEPPAASARGPVRFVSVGRFVPVKGFAELLHAFRLVADGGITARLVLVGDGPERRPCEALAKRLHVSDAVLFAGWQPHDQVLRELGRSDVFVLASHREGFAIVVAEAMAAGRPVVSTRVGGVPEVVEDGVTGLLVTPRDPRALADAMLGLARASRLRERMGRAGLQRARSLFTLERMTDQYVKAYAEAAARSHWCAPKLEKLLRASDEELTLRLVGELQGSEQPIAAARERVKRLLALPRHLPRDTAPGPRAHLLSSQIWAGRRSRAAVAADHLLLVERLLHERDRSAAVRVLFSGIAACPWHLPTLGFVSARLARKLSGRIRARAAASWAAMSTH
jgi:glycosyltransferase involved in cell wall biosynthesis